MRVWIVIAAAGVLLLPGLGEACPVCFSSQDENRTAFIFTTIFMTFLPLTLIGGTLWWLRRRFLKLNEADFASRAQEPQEPPRTSSPGTSPA